MINMPDDKVVVDAFVSHLRQNGYPHLEVDRRPDEENRESPDIDAIAGPFAIEHTSIDTVANQRRDSDRFGQIVRGLEDELSPKLHYRLNITLPYEGIQLGQDWSKLRELLREWIINESPNLPDGLHLLNDVPGIPFDLQVMKGTNRRPGLFFARFAPEDSSLQNRLSFQLTRKVQKLIPYKKVGYTTILLVESEDIALMNRCIMLDGVRNAFANRLPEGVDQIWYADTSIPDELLFHDFTKSITASVKKKR
jgi:hypothetical protein